MTLSAIVSVSSVQDAALSSQCPQPFILLQRRDARSQSLHHAAPLLAQPRIRSPRKHCSTLSAVHCLVALSYDCKSNSFCLKAACSHSCPRHSRYLRDRSRLSDAAQACSAAAFCVTQGPCINLAESPWGESYLLL